jgi:hypothetical protein
MFEMAQFNRHGHALEQEIFLKNGMDARDIGR